MPYDPDLLPYDPVLKTLHFLQKIAILKRLLLPEKNFI